MEVIKHTLDEQIIVPDILKKRILNKKICFMDIETTGFSRKYNHIILIGILYIDNSKTEIIQFFAANEKDEKTLLSEFKDFISDFEVVVTFNGDAFDIPFINSRLIHHRINYQLDKNQGIDILKVIRNKKNILGLEKCNLKSIEKFLGIAREDTINGKESIEMYYEYIKTKNDNIRDIILRHNYEDIYNLPKVMKIFDIIDEKSRINIDAMYLNYIIDIEIDVDSIVYNGNMIFIEGFTNTLKLSDEMYYGNTYVFKWLPRTGKFKVSLEIENGKLSDGSKCIYIDSNMYDLNIKNIDNLNYNLPDNIVILNHNGNIVTDNIVLLIKHLWQGLGKDKLELVSKERKICEDR